MPVSLNSESKRIWQQMMRFKVRLHKPLIHMHTLLIRTNAFTLMVMDTSWVRDDSFLFGRASLCGTL